MSTTDQQNVRVIGLPDGRVATHVDAGYLGTERIVPLAGEQYAFTVDKWRHRFEIYTSATGRSVRLWIDGEEVKW